MTQAELWTVRSYIQKYGCGEFASHVAGFVAETFQTEEGNARDQKHIY
jgi:hypothetical protein